MKKLIFIAVVAVAALAVILDDGRPRRRWPRGEPARPSRRSSRGSGIPSLQSSSSVMTTTPAAKPIHAW